MIHTLLHILFELFLLALIFALCRWLWSSICSMVERTIDLWRELKDYDDV